MDVKQSERIHRDGVSVIMPVLNEEKYLESALTRILNQSYDGPLEVVVAVGPSRDRTEEIATALAAREPRITVVPNPSGRTPSALNAAIAAAKFEILLRVDGHAELPDGYITTAVKLLHETGADNVGGVMAAVGVTSFEKAVALAMRSPLGVGAARFHTGGVAGPADTVYLGVFRRSALERVGGYDERFTRAQDWEMNLRLRRSGGLIWFSPDLEVIYRPRGSVRALARQYRDYGRWRRVVMRQHDGTANLRYLAPPLTLIACLLGLIGAVLVHPGLAILPVGYLGSIMLGSAAIGWRSRARAALWLPVILPTMHMSWGWGFLTSPRSLARE
jgi:succinoglycan biosynthesis protein ExoA